MRRMNNLNSTNGPLLQPQRTAVPRQPTIPMQHLIANTRTSMLSNLHMPRINATKAPALLADVGTA
jgi:hypothetical protein